MGPERQAGVSTLISEKPGLKLKSIQRDKRGYFILIKGKINPEDITIPNINVLYSSISHFIKSILLDFKI